MKGSWWRNSQTISFTFIVVKSESLCLRVSLPAPFYYKLLKIGIQSAKAIRKDVLLLLHPHHQQHTEASGKRLFKAVYPEYTYRIWSLGYYLLRDPLLMSTLINAMFWHGSPKKIGKNISIFGFLNTIPNPSCVWKWRSGVNGVWRAEEWWQ